MTEQEFGQIALKCEDKLRALARRFGLATDLAIDADDVVQEAFLALWNLSRKGYPVRDAEALLIKITKNICVSHYRKRHIDTESIVGDVFAGGESASRRLEEQDAERLRERLYSQLTSSELEFTKMREEQGSSLEEMSSESGRGKNVIKSLLSKAKRKMKEYLRINEYDERG